jgi:hypothetical protein
VYVVNGNNLATEGVLPQSWGYDAMDSTHIRAIHRRFGEHRLKSFPLLGFRDYYVTMLQKLKFVSPLNLMPDDKATAISHLEKNFGWRYYGGKHYESIWTHWYQAHYLPVKFGYDKRKAHLSSLIVAGSMTRDEALREMEKPLYTDNALKDDTAFVAKKLGFTVEELEALMTAPPRHYKEYPTNQPQIRRHQLVQRLAFRARHWGNIGRSLPGRALRKLAKALSLRAG